jgi:hypothetical protein
MPGASFAALPIFNPPFFEEDEPLALLRVLELLEPPLEPPQLARIAVKARADNMSVKGFPTNLKFIKTNYYIFFLNEINLKKLCSTCTAYTIKSNSSKLRDFLIIHVKYPHFFVTTSRFLT